MQPHARSEVNSWHHAVSAAHKWGGTPEHYIDVEEFLDSSKKIIGDARHRSIYHHTEGVWLCQRIFGRVIRLESGCRVKLIPVRLVAERHILEDLGRLPSPKDYIDGMLLQPWMSGATRREVPLADILGAQ
jgi:hypothetical protein